MNESLQRELRLRNALKNALGAWVADTAGETGSPAVYNEAEAAIADRIEHCQKYHSGSAIVKTLTNQDGRAFAVYLSDGQKIGIERDGGAAWLRIEPTPIVREAGE